MRLKFNYQESAGYFLSAISRIELLRAHTPNLHKILFADYLHEIASDYQDVKSYEQAEPAAISALLGYQKKNSKDHLSVATTPNYLEHLYFEQGKIKSATEHLEKALKLFEKTWVDERPSVIIMQVNLNYVNNR